LLSFVVENCHYLPSSGLFLAHFRLQKTSTNMTFYFLTCSEGVIAFID